jgi:hypothetical protein
MILPLTKSLTTSLGGDMFKIADIVQFTAFGQSDNFGIVEEVSKNNRIITVKWFNKGFSNKYRSCDLTLIKRV